MRSKRAGYVAALLAWSFAAPGGGAGAAPVERPAVLTLSVRVGTIDSSLSLIHI